MRGLWTMVHGMGFGALYLLACSFAIVELYRRYKPRSLQPISEADEKFLGTWLVAMAVIAWITVLTGAYVIYPWYRAIPSAGAAIGAFPQALLKAHPNTIRWHTIGMEWKEHIAWFAPISMTMAAAVFLHYRRCLTNYPQIRNAVLIFIFVSFASAGIAGFFGAELNKHAPVEGGGTIQLMHGGR
ncbi:MAG TPA: hypothetical protein VK574_01705 [Terracidiphilus sp.]|nr:hypothetical protein [Terracidiphilus sp.]